MARSYNHATWRPDLPPPGHPAIGLICELVRNPDDWILWAFAYGSGRR
jgi:hypothetical protein